MNIENNINNELLGKPSIEKRWLNTKYTKFNKSKPQLSLYEYLYEQNVQGMNDIAFSFMGRKITYEEFFTRIDDISKSFKSMGVKSGDIIPLIFATIPEAAYCFYALNKIGAVSCMIDPRLNDYGLMRDLNLINSEIVVSITNTCNILNNIKDQTKIKDIIMLSALNSAKNPLLRGIMNLNDLVIKNKISNHYINWSSFLQKSYSQSINNSYYPNRPATIVFTGGTTGVHKGVVLSDDAINATVHEHRFLIDDIERGEKFLDILPPFIAYGLTSMHLSLSYGLETILDPLPNPKMFAKQICKYKPSIVFGGPIHWEALANSKEIKKSNLSHLKYPVSGGEKLPFATEQKINKVLLEHNCKNEIMDGYGASECCGVFSIKFSTKNTKGTVGYPLRYNNMCIIDCNTLKEKDYNEPGEICISGPSLMNEYFKNKEETEKAFITDAYGRKWLKTGDLGMINENGELVITGRSKRIFVCGVNKVYPPEMESLIMAIPGIRKCVVTGVKDDILRAVPKVHILLEDSYNNYEYKNYIIDHIKNIISTKIGIDVVPKYYSFDEQFLYTGSGKIDYVKMTDNDNKMLIEKEKVFIKRK